MTTDPQADLKALERRHDFFIGIEVFVEVSMVFITDADASLSGVGKERCQLVEVGLRPLNGLAPRCVKSLSMSLLRKLCCTLR